MLLAHISDPHVIEWSGTSWPRFLGKRLTGAANFAFRRAKVHKREVLRALLQDAALLGCDHLAVTGDISSMAFPRELRLFGDMLEQEGFDAQRVSVIPGNHDAYTRRSWKKRRLLAELGRFATSDLHGDMPGYPFVRIRGPLALVGLDSAVPRPAFVASGRLGDEQLAALVDLLQSPPVAERFPVILIHHPPVPYPSAMKEAHSGLEDRTALLEALRRGLEGRDAVVLSGHWHRRQRHRLDLPGRVDLYIAPSASHLGGSPERLGGYHLFRFRESGKTGVEVESVETRAYQPDLGRVVELQG